MNFATISIPDISKIEDASLEPFGLGCISAADELGIFDSLAAGARTADELGKLLNLSPQAVDRICRVLVAGDFMGLDGQHFSLTDIARAYFVSASPLFRGPTLSRWREDRAHKRIVATAKEGWSPIADKEKSFTEQWEKGEISIEGARHFTAMMHSLILAPSIAAARSGAFENINHIVDVGGGSGAFAMALKAANPKTIVTLFDLPAVCEVAKENLASNGFLSQVVLFPGNFFSDNWPEGCDGMYLSNILHDWPIPRCEEILANVFKRLPVGGKVFINEVLLAEDGISPRMAVLFHLLMYMNHRAQQFRFSELADLLNRVGFRDVRIESRYSYYSLISATKDR
jgi:hypothetical protein